MSSEIPRGKLESRDLVFERKYDEAIRKVHEKIRSVDTAASNNPSIPYKKGKEQYYRKCQGKFRASIRLFEDMLQKRDPRLVDAVKEGLLQKLSTMGHKPAKERIDLIHAAMKNGRSLSIIELVELTTVSALEDKNAGLADLAMEHPDGVAEVEEELLELVINPLDKELEDLLPEEIVEVDGFPQRRKQTNYISEIFEKIRGDLPRDEEFDKLREHMEQEYHEFHKDE